jgi:hypothetical protein
VSIRTPGTPHRTAQFDHELAHHFGFCYKVSTCLSRCITIIVQCRCIVECCGGRRSRGSASHCSRYRILLVYESTTAHHRRLTHKRKTKQVQFHAVVARHGCLWSARPACDAIGRRLGAQIAGAARSASRLGGARARAIFFLITCDAFRLTAHIPMYDKRQFFHQHQRRLPIL